MQEIIIRAGCFIAIIVLGYVLRRIGFFQDQDFKVLSKITLKITLPAAIITSFADKVIDPALLSIALLGLIGGLVYMGLGYLLYLHRDREEQAFAILNISGYNIGNFTLPFVQSFLGPMGVITTGLFDIGNSFVCLGGAYGVASIVKSKERFSILKIFKALVHSVAFDCYILMIILNLTHIAIPGPIVSLAEIIGNANAFVAMLMLGVGFRLAGDWQQMGKILKIISVRYGIALLFALLFFFLLPFPLEVRQALAVLAFGPIASAVPAFTEEMKSDVGLSSAINSISIVCSILCIVIILLLVL
ncbi:MAG: AEC family transporter [Lachnospiraceae bacterium]